MPSAFDIKVRIPGGVSYPDFDKKAIKKGMRTAARPLVKKARKLVSVKGGVSKPDTFPHRHSGDLRREIKSHVSKSGFSFAVAESGKKLNPYYPAFVYYGHRAPYTETKLQARQHKKRSGTKVALPRKNWIFEATEEYARTDWPKDAQKILMDGLKTVFQK